jgi:excisionase family DNA binding protein
MSSLKTDTPQNHDTLLTVKEAAAALSCGITMTYRFLNSGRLRGVKIGKKTLVPNSAVTEFIGSLKAFKTEG